MIAVRQIHDVLADVIPVPPELRHRKTEVIFIAIDESPAEKAESASSERDSRKQAASLSELIGSVGDFPEREAQGDFDSRLELP